MSLGVGVSEDLKWVSFYATDFPYFKHDGFYISYNGFSWSGKVVARIKIIGDA